MTDRARRARTSGTSKNLRMDVPFWQELPFRVACRGAGLGFTTGRHEGHLGRLPWPEATRRYCQEYGTSARTRCAYTFEQGQGSVVGQALVRSAIAARTALRGTGLVST